MNLSNRQFEALLEAELVPALGCTEPIAIAYAAAKAREALRAFPESLLVRCSGNIVKNVKSVTVPHTGGLKGIAAAAVAGVVGGDAARELEVLSAMDAAAIQRTSHLLEQDFCRTELLDTPIPLHLEVYVSAGAETALVEIAHQHTHIVRIERNGETVLRGDPLLSIGAEGEAGSFTVDDILDYAESAELTAVRPLLMRQIRCNTAISAEGLANACGAGIGAGLLRSGGEDVRQRAKAAAAAASDARMSGCGLPVVINCGSGNQGITTCIPVVEYARHWGLDEERTLRALLVSNLIAIHLKQGIGRLSAYCGVVTAASGSGAAITWMAGGDRRQIGDTLINALANLSGVICDGAKASCAAKIASSVEAAILAHEMAMQGRRFAPGDGIVGDDVEETIRNVGVLAREGMHDTDHTILKIMMK